MAPTVVADATRRSSFEVVAAERHFRAMGSDAHVVVWQDRSALVGPEDLLDRAEGALLDLEQRWSRFLPSSEISAINQAAGEPVSVSQLTMDVLTWSERFRRWSDGRFDVTLLDELEAEGYDRSFDLLDTARPPRTAGPARDRRRMGARPAPRRVLNHGPEDDHAIVLDRASRTAAAPRGRRLDLGGIGKGRAADLVAADLVREGASGACVNLGGDLRVIGETPEVDGIAVSVEDPRDPTSEVTRVLVRNAAVATSACTRRTWLGAGGPVHHLIDPATGRSAGSSWISVTAVAPTAMLAEVIAKTSFLGGEVRRPESGVRIEAPRLLTARDGTLHRADGFEAFER